MSLTLQKTFPNNNNKPSSPFVLSFNSKDIVAFIIFVAFILLYRYGWQDMHRPLNDFQPETQGSLSELPYDMLRTTMRLVIGLFFSFIFAIVAGVAAAKNKHLERVILPFINVMESVPLLGFITFSTIIFINLFPNSVMGLEAAAIFGVFTGQAWNMALVVYQTLRIVPKEVEEAAQLFQLNAWQKFWRVEFPYTIPGLLWNTMVSQAAAWFAIVASEIIPLNGKDMPLHGVGTFIQIGLDNADVKMIVWAVIAIILNILLFDQLFFRPLVRWSEKFKYESITTSQHNTSWFYDLLSSTVLLPRLLQPLKVIAEIAINGSKRYLPTRQKTSLLPKWLKQLSVMAWYGAILYFCATWLYSLWNYVPHHEILAMAPLMLETTLRVAAAMLLSLIIGVPVGVWIGLSPRATRIAQPIIQIGSALPPNIFFPFVTLALVATHMSLNLWTIPLIMLGTTWYVLFNVIAGVSTLPQEMKELAILFKLKGRTWWMRFMLPAIFPYILTGIISAAGGAWNSAICAELLQWGSNTVHTSGLGYYISKATIDNALPQAALGCVSMSVLVGICIVFIWRPLYKMAERRYKIS
ncbi:ABC transporter permease subunit [Vibrio sp. S4M6]|uniref:ABC transporter permease n=1 Tax=Vibrio sinus TaxID=2946865 RepID=UPI00202A05D2|nr:ABC transporter permease subunit [Vibrio sinus]MCL9780145.1 ABC transporter permease subunit [Vibrio sinus]